MIIEILYEVGIENQRTGERLNVEVWGECGMQATGKLTNSLIGYDKPYAWTGTSPIYQNNKLVTREVEYKE